MEFRTDDAQLLGLWTATRLLGEIRQSEDRGNQAELLTNAQILLTAFMVGLEPVLPGQTSAVPVRGGRDQVVRLTPREGGISQWTAFLLARRSPGSPLAASTLGPLIALIVGFAGADWFLGRRLGEASDHAPLEEPRARPIDDGAPAYLGPDGRRL